MSHHSTPRVLRAGTRASALALWQTRRVAGRIGEIDASYRVDEVVLSTRGDRDMDTPLPSIGGKGVFTEELEQALRSGRIDLAVHSLKDLPTQPASGVVIAALCCRGDVRDVLVSRSGAPLSGLRSGAVVGTSSTRRSAQIGVVRPDIEVRPIRGNVDTRLRKVEDGDYDAAVLAAAGLERLGLSDRIAEYLPVASFLPAPGQGALAVQCREGDPVADLLARMDEAAVRACTLAERSLLAELGGGCSMPVAALGEITDGALALRGWVGGPPGTRPVAGSETGDPADASGIGRRLAERLLAEGARALLP